MITMIGCDDACQAFDIFEDIEHVQTGHKLVRQKLSHVHTCQFYMIDGDEDDGGDGSYR